MSAEPVAPKVNVANIPAALRSEERWTVWRYEWDGKRWGKVPRDKVNYPAAWRSFEEAVLAYQHEDWDGLGFVLGDGWAGADLDHCVVDGAVDSRAQLCLETLADTYVEMSPSLGGYKAIFRAERLGFQIDYSQDPPVTTSWTGSRYFTVTGLGKGDPTEDGNLLVGFWAPPVEAPTIAQGGGWEGAAENDDDNLLARIVGDDGPHHKKFFRLWCGDITGYASHSEADLALCAILAWWTNYDRERVDRLYRMSDLMRAKWNVPTYRNSVLRRACMRRVV